jgi:5-methylcytosine-specific restriction enzyme subunit McrC
VESEPRYLRLRERSVEQGIRLSADEVRVLRAAGAGLTVIATGTSGTFDVVTSSSVGSVVGPTFRMVIEPKVPIRSVLHLMQAYSRMPRFSDDVKVAENVDLLSAMQAIYGQALGRAMELGLVTGYREVSDALDSPRGRIDALSLATRRFGLLPPVDCTFSELTEDTEINRRLFSAARLLALAPLREVSHQDKLRELIDRFHNVAAVEFRSGSLRPLSLDRRTARFSVALGLAELVLKNASTELMSGRTPSVGFLVDMDVLFEEFVLDVLGRAFGSQAGGTFRVQPGGLFLDLRRQLSITPDGVWADSAGEWQLVVDTKYKVTGVGKVADVYQMVGYATALGVKHAALVYAEADRYTHRIRNSDVTVHVFGMDLSVTPREISAQAEQIAVELLAVANVSA